MIIAALLAIGTLYFVVFYYKAHFTTYERDRVYGEGFISPEEWNKNLAMKSCAMVASAAMLIACYMVKGKFKSFDPFIPIIIMLMGMIWMVLLFNFLRYKGLCLKGRLEAFGLLPPIYVTYSYEYNFEELDPFGKVRSAAATFSTAAIVFAAVYTEYLFCSSQTAGLLYTFLFLFAITFIYLLCKVKDGGLFVIGVGFLFFLCSFNNTQAYVRVLVFAIALVCCKRVWPNFHWSWIEFFKDVWLDLKYFDISLVLARLGHVIISAYVACQGIGILLEKMFPVQ